VLRALSAATARIALLLRARRCTLANSDIDPPRGVANDVVCTTRLDARLLLSVLVMAMLLLASSLLLLPRGFLARLLGALFPGSLLLGAALKRKHLHLSLIGRLLRCLCGHHGHANRATACCSSRGFRLVVHVRTPFMRQRLHLRRSPSPRRGR
jgi:hypothetical protein